MLGKEESESVKSIKSELVVFQIRAEEKSVKMKKVKKQIKETT